MRVPWWHAISGTLRDADTRQRQDRNTASLIYSMNNAWECISSMVFIALVSYSMKYVLYSATRRNMTTTLEITNSTVIALTSTLRMPLDPLATANTVGDDSSASDFTMSPFMLSPFERRRRMPSSVYRTAPGAARLDADCSTSSPAAEMARRDVELEEHVNDPLRVLAAIASKPAS